MIPVGTVKYTKQNGSTGTLTYQFEVRNNLSTPLYLTNSSASGSLPNMLLDSTTCNFYARGQKQALSPGSTCVLVYTSDIPTLPAGVNEQTYLDTISVSSQVGYTARYYGAGVTVNNSVAKSGRFQFKKSDGAPLLQLALGPNAKKSFIVENTGNAAITTSGNSVITLPPGLKTNGFSTTCGNTLAAGKSCDIAYQVPSVPTAGSYYIGVNGDADNNTIQLPVRISKAGYFTFSSSSLSLKPGASGTITVSNTGGANITGTGGDPVIYLSSDLQTDGFTTTCGNTLMVGQSCNIEVTH